MLIYADLPGMSQNQRTIPADILATRVSQDIVIVIRQEKSIYRTFEIIL